MAAKMVIATLCMVAMQSTTTVLAQGTVKVNNKVECNELGYRNICYGYAQYCPDECAYGCVMDCKSCKAVCPCNKPGGVCQDPRFIGGDGIMFYFHGKRDSTFCLLSDSELHINAHFIGKRGERMGRDFTWVQSIGVLFGGNNNNDKKKHKLFLGANRVSSSSWDDSLDQLSIALDGNSIQLPSEGGATATLPLSSASNLNDLITIVRSDKANAVTVQVEKEFTITARVVPITPEESRVHKYGITGESEDCFAHLELSFKFYSLSPTVTGVLGQTYGAEYRSPINLGAAMPVVGGEADYVTTDLFATDCKVARYGSPSNNNDGDNNGFSIVDLNCAGRPDGRGMVCRR